VKAITLKRPWTWAILHGGKDIENRFWKPSQPLPFQLAIHVGLGFDPLADAYIYDQCGRYPDSHSVFRGSIIAVVTVHHLIAPARNPVTKWHMPEQWGWMLKDLAILPEPVPCRGALSLWDIPADVLARIQEQLHGVAR